MRISDWSSDVCSSDLLNVQRFHLNRLCSFFSLYFLVEELLTAWCGEHRVGNLFCLRAKDAPAIVSEIKKTLQNEKIYFHAGMHYAGLNAGAITKFGSVEIQSLRDRKSNRMNSRHYRASRMPTSVLQQ